MEQDYRPSKDLRDAMVVISSTTTSSGNVGGTTLIDTVLTQGNDYWINMSVVILSGNSNGQIRRISAFTAASDTITVDTAFASQILVGTRYDIIAQYASAAISPSSVSNIGIRQVFEKAITSATNAGAVTLGTVTTQSCIIESIIIQTNAALEANTTCAVTGAAGVITFIDSGIANATNLSAADKQVAWSGGGSGVVHLNATKTIITTLAGGAGAASNLTFIITYYSSSANGGTII